MAEVMRFREMDGEFVVDGNSCGLVYGEDFVLSVDEQENPGQAMVAMANVLRSIAVKLETLAPLRWEDSGE